MQGLTELMFRKVYERCFPGALSLAISPFLSLTHGNLNDAWKKIDDVLPEANRDSIPVIPQILGKETEEFVALCNRLYDVGYKEVNWNIGCPMRRVTAKYRGSGILPYPDKVRSILDYVVPKLKPQLSVKMRLGLQQKEEIFDIIPVLNDYPLSSVTIHPRTGRQQYGGQVDVDTFAQASSLLHHHVIYNGDICSVDDYQRLSQRFPQLSDWMIGRGVLYNPLLPCDIQSHKAGRPITDPDTRTQKTHHFIATLMAAICTRPISDEAKLRKIKEYWCLIRHSLPITEQQSTTVLHATTLSETLSLITQLSQNRF